MNRARKTQLRKLENNLLKDNIPGYEYRVKPGADPYAKVKAGQKPKKCNLPTVGTEPQSINHARRAKKYAQTYQLPLNAGIALYDLHVRQAAVQRNLKETEELAHTK